MSFPPQLFIIGAQKSGTTGLATLLGQHPDICVARTKEPHYFTRHHDKGPDWYRKQFDDPDAPWLLDASTSYSSAPSARVTPEVPLDPRYSGVPERIAALCGPTPKLIYIMRDPADRAYSAYWHAVRAGRETRDFDDALDAGLYMVSSDYAEQLRVYFKVFPRDNLLPLVFEEYAADPQRWARHCFRFIGVADDVALSDGEGRHKSFVYRGVLGAANSRVGVSPLFAALSTVTPRPVKRVASRLLTKPVPKMNARQRERLNSCFRPMIDELAELIGRPAETLFRR